MRKGCKFSSKPNTRVEVSVGEDAIHITTTCLIDSNLVVKGSDNVIRTFKDKSLVRNTIGLLKESYWKILPIVMENGNASRANTRFKEIMGEGVTLKMNVE